MSQVVYISRLKRIFFHNLRGELEEKMDPEEKNDLVEQAYFYIMHKTYPDGCTENEKRAIRNKAKRFVAKDGELFYKQRQKGVSSCTH